MRLLYFFFAAIIKTILMFFIYFFSGFVKKNKKKWGFGSWGGKEFRGNTRHLYQYVRDNHKEIEIFWVSKTKSQHEKLLKKGINSVYAYSFNGFIKISTAGVIFLSHGSPDIISCLTKNSILVQLGHVTFTIKENSYRETLRKKTFIKKIYNQCILFYEHIAKIDYGIYSSEDAEKNLKFFDKNYPKKQLKLGLPKTDYLYNLKMNKVNFNLEKEVLGKTIPKNEKVILFLPTWRDDKKFSIFNFGFSPEKISHFLKKNKCHFYINFHPFNNELKNINAFSLKNFNLANFDGHSINHMLNLSDLLITDYSSIFSDYLIFDKPIIFAKFDHLNYLKDRGIKINYEDLPGPKVSDWDELLNETNKILYDVDLFIDSRNNWKKKVYKNLDGNNCKRITEFFKSRTESQ